MRIFQNVALVVLTGFIIWKGIYPALTQVDTDFPNYYTSAKLIMDHKDISRVYDDEWFQEQIFYYGMNTEGKFTPFPPPTAFIMVPFVAQSPLTSLRLWTLLNIVVLVGIILLMKRVTDKDWRWNSLLILSSGIGLANNFRFGQFYLILVLLILGGYLLWRNQKLSSSGILFGIGAALKYFPVVFLPFFLLRREWKIVLSCLMIVACIYGSSILVLGLNIHEQFLSSIFTDHLSGNIQNPFSATFQSWNALLRRLFAYDSTFNTNPIFNSLTLLFILKYLIIASVLVTVVISSVRAQRNFASGSPQVQFALIAIGALLLLPAGATYHFLLLALPVALIVSIGNTPVIEQQILLWLYVALGFIPYALFRPYDGKGLLTILAYPRLWILTAIFLVAVKLCWNYKIDEANQLSTFSLKP